MSADRPCEKQQLRDSMKCEQGVEGRLMYRREFGQERASRFSNLVLSLMRQAFRPDLAPNDICVASCSNKNHSTSCLFATTVDKATVSFLSYIHTEFSSAMKSQDWIALLLSRGS